MLCPKCGTANPTGANFCQKCGIRFMNPPPTNIYNVPVQPVQAQPPQQQSYNNMYNTNNVQPPIPQRVPTPPQQAIVCPRCGSSNFSLQVVQERPPHSVIWWLCVGWWWIPIKWCIFGIFALCIRRKKQNISLAICHNCGQNWKITR